MRRLLTPGWLAIHTLALVLVSGMLWLAWWQLTRATGGNPLSWGYAFQWPVFAGFVVFVWVREARRSVRGTPRQPPVPVPGSAAPPRPSSPAPSPSAASPGSAAANPAPRITRRPAPIPVSYDEAEEPELAAYNRYLAWLSANPSARVVDYPG